jgi:hypothetical protein
MESPMNQASGGEYGPTGAGPGMTAAPRPKVRPGRIWYLPALLVFLGGFAWLIFGLFSLAGQVNSFQRVPLPAGGTVTLSHAGGYIVYYEAPGANRRNARVPAFRIQVVPASAGAAVASLKTYGSNVTYGFSSHRGRAELTLQVTHPGTFRVVTQGAPPATAAADLAFGGSIAGGIVKVVLLTLLLVLVGAAGAIVVFVIRLVKTQRQRRTPHPGHPPNPGQPYPGHPPNPGQPNPGHPPNPGQPNPGQPPYPGQQP